MQMPTRSVLGSLLLVTACATDAEMSPRADEPIERRVPTSPAQADECQGEKVAKATLHATLAVDPVGGLATVTIENHTQAGHIPDVIIQTRKSGERAHLVGGEPVYVAAGSSGVVRFPLSALGLDPLMPNQLVAEVAIRDSAGAVIERAFAHADVGPSLSATASRLGIPMTSSLKGLQVKLGAIATGGAGAEMSSFRPTEDTIDELAQNPTLPLPSFNYDMCFRWPVSLVDAGFGEDYGTDPTSPWVARGGRVSIVRKGKTLFDGYLDAHGCTGTFKATGSTDFSIFGYSRAKIADNDIIARDSTGTMASFVIWDADPGMNQHPVYVFPEVRPVTTLLAVSAYTLQKFPGGMSGKTIPVEHRCQPVLNGCCNCANSSGIWIDDFGADKKFMISHEMGHRILTLFTGGTLNDVGFDLDPTDANPVCDTSTSHAMWSAEFDSGAAMEGWAHFIAVAAFNDRAGDNPGAQMRYWSSANTIDVEQGSPGFPQNYFDTVCPSIASASKLGVELDWLRHWWDYYTNALDVDPGVRPTVTQMMNEIDASPVWDSDGAWESIRQGVNTYSGAAQQDRWDQHGAWNGVD